MDRAGIEGGQLAPFAGAAAPGRQDVLEGGVGAGQRRLGTEMERNVGHRTAPQWSDALSNPRFGLLPGPLQMTVCPVLIKKPHVMGAPSTEPSPRSTNSF